MDGLLACLTEFYNPKCESQRRLALQNHLLAAQSSLPNEQVECLLRAESPLIHIFTLQSICMRPEHFQPSRELLYKWYITNQQISPEVVKYGGMALASLLLESNADELKRELDMCQGASPVLYCILISETSTMIHRKLSASVASKAVLFPLQQVLSKNLTDYLLLAVGGLEHFEADAAKAALSICPKNLTSALLNALLAKAARGFRSSIEWVNLLNACLEVCAFEDLVDLYKSVLKDDPTMLTPVLAGLQEQMDKFCSSYARRLFYNDLACCLVKAPADGIVKSIGFWEVLACDLYDSDLIGEEEKSLFRTFFELAVHIDMPKDVADSVVAITYKVIGDELVNMCINAYISSGKNRFVDFLVLLGPEYIGQLSSIQTLLSHLYDRNPGLFIDVVRSYHRSILRSAPMAEFCCSMLASLLKYENLLTPCIESLCLYSEFITNDLILSCVSISRNLEISIAIKVAQMCAKACIKQQASFNNEIMEYACKNDRRVPIISEFLRNDQFEFESTETASLLHMIKELSRKHTDDSESEFLILSIPRVAKCNPKICEYLLKELDLNEDAYLVYLVAETTQHFDECFDAISYGLQRGSFHENLTRLFTQAMLKRFDKIMDFGIEHSCKIVDICLAKLQSPMEKSELESILELFKVIFLVKQSECEENWRLYLVQQKYKEIFDSLLQASHLLNREMNEKIAVFFCSVNQESPEHLVNWVRSNVYHDKLAWMPKCVRMNEFIQQYHLLFK